MEIKILIEAPELAASLNNLAAAVSNFGEIKVQPVIAADTVDKGSKPRRRKNDKPTAEEVPAQVEAPGVQNPDAPAPVEPPHTVPGPAPVPPITPASVAPAAPTAPVVAPAPVAQAPVVQQPAAPAPAPVVENPTAQPQMVVAPTAAAPQNVLPVITAAPATEQPQPRQYTMQDIAKVGSSLLDKGMMPQLSAILAEMGVQAIPQLRPEQYPVVAEKLIALGGKFE